MQQRHLNLLSLLIVCSVAHCIQWNGNWASSCDFKGKDLKHIKTRGEDCGNMCKNTAGCTHFSWNKFEGGTCWMKTGGAHKGEAVPNSDPSSVCGIVGNNAGGGGGGGGGGGNGLGSDKGGTIGVTFKKGKLNWADEFDNMAALHAHWYLEVNNAPPNKEAQAYTNRNYYLHDSMLTIEARKENVGNQHYTSSKLRSHRTFRYGSFEMRAKLPRGRGTWPAFWLVARPGHWPDDGELDILEHVGYDMGTIHSNVHTQKFNHMKGTNIGNRVKVANVDTEFHLYQCEWRPERVSFFVDGREIFTYRKTDPSYGAWPFDNPHQAILNLAIGGNWGGKQGIDNGVFPAKFVIDYVRYYDLA